MKISILGCGWLGLPAARLMIAEGYEVMATTTTPGKLPLLEAAGIHARLLHAAEVTPAEFTDFFDADKVIINIPPRLRHGNPEEFLNQIDTIVKGLQPATAREVCFVSSTSVYPDCNGPVDETLQISPDDATANHTLLQSEERIRSVTGKTIMVLRPGGLLGYDRVPVKYFAGKKEVKGAHAPVNFIHRDDAANALLQLCKQGMRSGVYNLCAPEHPLRGELYPADAGKYGYAAPEFDPNDSSSWKLVNGDKFTREYNFEYRYPDPAGFYYEPGN